MLYTGTARTVTKVDNPARSEIDKTKRPATGTALAERLEGLSKGHPSEQGYFDAPEQHRPLTDGEHAERVADVKARLEKARAAGLSTDRLHTIDPEREVWSKERRSEHDAIVEELYARASSVPCERKAIMAGGLPGAGKTTVLTEHAHIDRSRYLMINPDLIKEELARRNLIPQVDDLSPMEASDLVHEESSHLAKRLARRAEAAGKNLIWDVTMSSVASTERRVESLRGAGYVEVEAIFVDIPIEVSIRRADSRHREDHDEFRAGRGIGGRLIPGETILDHADAQWGSQNRKCFEQLKSRFDCWSIYDNSVDGRAPVLAESSSTDLAEEPTK